MRPVTRVTPKLPAEAMKTYTVASPLATHHRPATCAEVDCGAYRNGWRVRVEGLTPEQLHTATNAGRRYRQLDVAEGEAWLVFEAGQPCFRASQHTVSVDRPEIYLVRDGDWRGNPRGTTPVRHSGPDPWLNDFADHQERLQRTVEKG